MVTIICDSCRKQIKDASKDLNYVTIKDKALCLSCKRAFDDKVSASMAAKRKYSLSDFQKAYTDTLVKVCK
jgi:hypothetical protein